MENDYGREFVRTGPPTDPLHVTERKLQLCRPCPCGTCQTDTAKTHVGYVTGGTTSGYVTIWVEHEDVYKMLQALFWAHGLKAAV